MKKRLKILHVISQRPDSTGSGIYLQEILAESARRGYQNYLVAAVQANSTIALPFISPAHCHLIYFDDKNGSDKIIGMSDVMPYPSRKFQDLSGDALKKYLETFRKPLARIVSRHNPDIIHSHHLWLLTSLVRDLFPDTPLITSCHGSDLRQYKQCPHLRELVLNGCRRVNKVLALSPEQKDEIIELIGLPENKIDMTGAGYNKTIFYPENHQKIQDTVNIIYAGKISRAKGVPWLIRALSKIDRLPYHLHLVGSGSGREYEECRTAAALIKPNVSFHGQLSQQELANLMRCSNIFVLPSLHEGLPLVVLEALACGCTVIATDLPGTREIQNRLASRQLILVEKPVVLDTDTTVLADEERFVESLRFCLEQCLSRQQKANTCETDLSYFRWESVFKRVEQCWIDILDDPL